MAVSVIFVALSKENSWYCEHVGNIGSRRLVHFYFYA